MPDAERGPRGSASHNAHIFDAVTVYYRWHPYFGQSLRVYQRKKARNGEYTVCQAPDGSTLSIPSWMLKLECAQSSLGAPQISVEALMRLRHLLSSLELTSTCDKHSVTPAHKEEVDEANGQDDRGTVQSATDKRTASGSFPRQARRTETGIDRAANQRRLSRGRNSRGKRR